MHNQAHSGRHHAMKAESKPNLKCNCKHFLELSKEKTVLISPALRFFDSFSFQAPASVDAPFINGTEPAPPERPPRVFAA
jgi:hypothetical protein